jgi:hypothetical protein
VSQTRQLPRATFSSCGNGQPIVATGTFNFQSCARLVDNDVLFTVRTCMADIHGTASYYGIGKAKSILQPTKARLAGAKPKSRDGVEGKHALFTSQHNAVIS